MRFKFFLSFLLLNILFLSGTAYAQLVADFNFEDISDVPNSLKVNSATGSTDAIRVNPYALSEADGSHGRGAYIDPNLPADTDGDIALAVDTAVFDSTKSISMRFEYKNQEPENTSGFVWFVNFGNGKFRFGHHPGNGFGVHYTTKANPNDLIFSEWQGADKAIQPGEFAVIEFVYDHLLGKAFIYKNNELLWETPEEKIRPDDIGSGIDLSAGWENEADNAYFLVGASIEAQKPSLFRFQAFKGTCDAPVAEFASDSVFVCVGEGGVPLTASGGEEGNYRWFTDESDTEPDPDQTGSTFQTEPFTVAGVYTYYVQIKGAECDSGREPVRVVVSEKPQVPSLADITFSDLCGPGNVVVSLPEKEGVYYNWYKTKDRSSLLEERRNSYPVQAGKDTSIYVIAFNEYCSSGDPERITIDIQEIPSIDAGPDRTILRGETVQLSAVINTDSISNVSWSPSASLDVPTSASPWASPVEDITYSITGFTAGGCEVSDSVTIRVIEEFPVTNAFSPDGAGPDDNEKWKIHNLHRNYPDCIVMVYNSWGNQVFYSEGYEEEWDGTFNGEELPGGTYYYTIILKNGEEPLRGSLMIIR